MLTKVRKKYIGDSAFYKMLLGVALPIMIQNGMRIMFQFISL